MDVSSASHSHALVSVFRKFGHLSPFKSFLAIQISQIKTKGLNHSTETRMSSFGVKSMT